MAHNSSTRGADEPLTPTTRSRTPSVSSRDHPAIGESFDFRYRLLGAEGLPLPWIARGDSDRRRFPFYPTFLSCFHPTASKMLADKVELKRDISLLYSASILTGIVIGSGIFISPVAIIQNVGSVGMSLLLWIVSGILTVFICLSYAELGSMFPRAGGDYAFFREVIGPVPAFLVAWMHLFTVEPGFYALLSLTTTNYILYPFYGDCIPVLAQRLLSVWILVSVVALNSVYVRYVTRVEVVFTAAKILALLVIVIGGAVNLFSAGEASANFREPFANTLWSPGAIAVALHSGIFTYSGWEYIFYLLEEMKKPEKILPPTIYSSLSLITVLYVLANAAYFTAMTPQEMMSSSAVAMTFAEKTLGRFSVVMPIFVAFSTIGALNGAILGASRVFFAAARDELFPEIIAMVHYKYLTPWPSLWTMTVAATVYILLGDPDALTMYLGFFYVMKFSMTMACVLWLRWKQPSRPRPIKVPLFMPVVSLVALVALEGLGFYQHPIANGIGLALVLVGLPFYVLGVLWKRKARTFIAWQTSFTQRTQQIFMLVRPKDYQEEPPEE